MNRNINNNYKCNWSSNNWHCTKERTNERIEQLLSLCEDSGWREKVVRRLSFFPSLIHSSFLSVFLSFFLTHARRTSFRLLARIYNDDNLSQLWQVCVDDQPARWMVVDGGGRRRRSRLSLFFLMTITITIITITIIIAIIIIIILCLSLGEPSARSPAVRSVPLCQVKFAIWIKLARVGCLACNFSFFTFLDFNTQNRLRPASRQSC